MKIKNPEPRNLSEVLKDCHMLVDELRDKLKKKCNDVLDLRKEVDRLNEPNRMADIEAWIDEDKYMITIEEL